MSNVLRLVKRDPAYRRTRCHVVQRCPTDVWLDRYQHLAFVMFGLEAGPVAGASHLVFAVDPERLSLERVRVVVHEPGAVRSFAPDSLPPC